MATILVVDDPPSNRQFLTTLLGYAGHRMLEAADGARALDLVRAERPELVITDILMPHMNGYDFIQRVRAEPDIARTPVIFYTASYSTPEAEALAKSCGVRKILAKPSEPKEILDAVNQALGIGEQRGAALPPAVGRQAGPATPRVDDTMTLFLKDIEEVKHRFDDLAANSPKLGLQRDAVKELSQKFAENVTRMQRLTTRLSALLEVGMEMMTERDPARLVELFFAAACDLIDSRYAAVGMLDESEQAVRIVFTRGFDAGILRGESSRTGLLGTLLAGERVLRLRSPDGAPDAQGLPDGHPTVRDLLGIPVASADRIYGWMYFADRSGHDGFSEEDTRLATVMTNKLALLFENAMLYDAIQRHAAKLQIEMTERRQTQQALVQSEAALHRAQLMAKLAHVVTGLDGRFESWSETLPPLIGIQPSEMPASTRQWLDRLHPDDRMFFRGKAIDAGIERARTEVEYRLRRADGAWIHIRQTMEPIHGEPDAEGETRWFNTLQDVSDHKQAEEKIERLNRVYAVLSGINSLIVRVRDREELFRESCRIAVEAGRLRLAWIGIVDRKSEEIVPAAFSGIEEGWLGMIRLSTREDSGRFGMAGRALRDRTAIVSNDLLADEQAFYRKESAQRGYRSLAMIPLVVRGGAFGVLGLHAAEAGFFSEEELKLLLELAGDIAFGLDHLEQEEKVKHLTRVHAVLSGINALIVRVRDRDELFREACRIAVEAGKFPKAWIGMIERDSQDVRVAAGHGADALFFEHLGAMLKEDTPQGNGVVARAVQQRQPVISNDLEHDPQVLGRENAVATGSRSLVVLPLVVANDIAGVLVLHADVPEFFDDDEMKLLLELAGDISFALEHIKKSEQVEYLAYYDVLTGLANSTLFRERLEQHIVAAANAQRSFALVVVNVDRFRAINDAFGRQAGDELLKQIAGRFVIAPGDSNRLARIGADHFAYVGTTAQSEEQVARRTDSRLNHWFGSPYRVGANELRVSVTAGIAMFPNDGTDGDELLRNAEAALKKAKATGARYLFFEQQMTERIAENLSLENKLRQALEKDEFVLHYQPKVDLETRVVVGVEALIRWQSPERGLVPPAHFIPLLEETGLILQVGSWALKRAARDHRSCVEQGLKAPRVAVNVSPLQLRQRDFVEVVKQAIGEGVAPTGIDLEITESLIMEDVRGNIAKLNAVRQLGITIGIDDFGTGYSSLGYLAKLPVESLKIDRSFIITMQNDPDAMTLVSTIISLAHSMRLKVVAEGVETEEQAKFLRLLRCDQMQGYLFSKPLPVEQLVPLLQNKG